MADTARRAGESERHYLWRLGNMKDSGQIDMNWQELADVINAHCRDSEEEYRTESAYRKRYAEGRGWYDEVFALMEEGDYLRQLRDEKYGLEKERVKLRDERGELSKLLREQARRESFVEMVRRSMAANVIPFEYVPKEVAGSDCDLIVPITDMHAGLCIQNSINRFDSDVLHTRLARYIDEIIAIQRTHNAQNCYVVLGGDLISGLIHSNIRIENNEHVVQQVKIACTYTSNFIWILSRYFDRIYVHSAPGNHSRLSPSKEEHIKGEELDALVPFYLSAVFKDSPAIHIAENAIDSDIASFSVRGHIWYAVHGDKDTPKNVVQDLTMITDVKPAGVLMGHRHSNGLTTVHSTKVVESGCMSGTDRYAFDKRLTGKPEQCVIVTTADAPIKCLYDVQLDDKAGDRYREEN